MSANVRQSQISHKCIQESGTGEEHIFGPGLGPDFIIFSRQFSLNLHLCMSRRGKLISSVFLSHGQKCLPVSLSFNPVILITGPWFLFSFGSVSSSFHLFSTLTARSWCFLGSVWSYLCEHVPVFVCVPPSFSHPLSLSLCLFSPYLEASRSSYSNTIA